MADQIPKVRDVEGTLRRVVVGWRVFSLVWMTALIIELAANDDPGNLGTALGVLALAVAWTGATVWAARDRHLLRSPSWLAADMVVAIIVSLGPAIADTSSNFFGGYPLSFPSSSWSPTPPGSAGSSPERSAARSCRRSR